MTSTAPSRRRLPRGLRVLLGVIVGLALIVVGVIVVGQVRQSLRTSGLQDAVDEAYAVARPEADGRQSAGDAVLTELLGPATRRSSAVTCTLDHSDAGLMVTSWSQTCEIRTVDAYETRLSYSELAAQLETSTRGMPGEVLGTPVADAAPAAGCGPVRGVGDPWNPSPQVALTRLQAGAFDRDDPDRDLESDCRVPRPVLDVDTTRIASSFDQEAITNDRSWVVVERRTEFLTRDLGCVGLVFCRAPIRSAQLPTQ